MPRRTRQALCVLAALVAVAALAAHLLRQDRTLAWIKGHTVHLVDRRSALDERAVADLFELARVGDHFEYDPVAHLVSLPDQVQEWPWPEHPSGKIVLRTNNLGLREDEPTLAQKRGLRILVAGDSHTAGVTDNAQSFANLLETRLRAEPGRESLEVLNAGVPYTGPYCYLGVLQKHLALAPDVFVAVLFTGNDFWDDLKVAYYLDGWSPPKGDEEYRARIGEAAERWGGPVSQGFNQAFRWKHYSFESERSLSEVIESFTRMRDLCSEHGILFLAVVLPTKVDVEPEDDAATQEAVRVALGVSLEDAGINRRLGARFAQAMETAGIRCLDPFDAMRRAPHPLYWRRDYHLALSGHALLAELLATELRERL